MRAKHVRKREKGEREITANSHGRNPSLLAAKPDAPRSPATPAPSWGASPKFLLHGCCCPVSVTPQRHRCRSCSLIRQATAMPSLLPLSSQRRRCPTASFLVLWRYRLLPRDRRQLLLWFPCDELLHHHLAKAWCSHYDTTAGRNIVMLSCDPRAHVGPVAAPPRCQRPPCSAYTVRSTGLPFIVWAPPLSLAVTIPIQFHCLNLESYLRN